MSISAMLWRNRSKLVQSFHIAILHGLINTWRRCENLRTTPQEPDFVADIVIERSPLIYSALKSVLSSCQISLSMSAVFCHQTPKVAFGSHAPASCELGDILFAYVHTPKIGSPIRNAILFQAKASTRQSYRIHRDEINQLLLYKEWLDFVYKRSFLKGQKRSVSPKAPHPGARYLLMDNRSPEDPRSRLLGFRGTYPIGCCMPDEVLRYHSTQSAELFSLLIFRTGRTFEDKQTAAKKQDWSQVVWDLLEIGIKKLFNRKNSARRNMPRGAGDTIQMMDGLSYSMGSSLLSYSTATEIVGWNVARSIYGGNYNGIPPASSEMEGDPDEP